jgi:predicted DsbA family dithiol-disulfide isomerase
MISKKKQAVARFSGPTNPLDVAGAKVGIRFNRSRRVIPTMRAHRLMEFCNSTHPEKSSALMNILFRRYFEEAQDVSKVDVLLQAAIECGLSQEESRSVLESDAFKTEVEQHLMVAKRMRVSGVPYVIIESGDERRPIAFSGAQPPEAIAEMLLEATEPK